MEEKIVLGDGKEYTLSSFNIGDFVEIEEQFGSVDLDTTKMKTTVYWIFLAIKKKHKELTLEGLYELITAAYISDGGIIKLLGIMSRLNGWDKNADKDANIKNAPAPKVENQ